MSRDWKVVHMKVLLKQDVQGVGKAGEVKDVSDGYARNFLLRRGLAAAATETALRQAAQVRSTAERHARDEENAARALKERLEARPIVVEARAGAQGRLYGSITNGDVADAVQKQLEVEIDRREIDVPEPIRQLGTFRATARLHPKVTATLAVEVRSEGAS